MLEWLFTNMRCAPVISQHPTLQSRQRWLILPPVQNIARCCEVDERISLAANWLRMRTVQTNWLQSELDHINHDFHPTMISIIQTREDATKGHSNVLWNRNLGTLLPFGPNFIRVGEDKNGQWKIGGERVDNKWSGAPTVDRLPSQSAAAPRRHLLRITAGKVGTCRVGIFKSFLLSYSRTLCLVCIARFHLWLAIMESAASASKWQVWVISWK